MKKPTLEAFYYADLARAAQATINQLEQWITRKQFTPSRETVRGSSRRFNENDACRVAIMAYMVNRCGLPLGVGAHVAQMLRDQQHLLADMADLDIYAIVFADEAHAIGKLPNEASAKGITFAVNWDKNTGSVMNLLHDREPTGVTIVNMSRLARNARNRLAKHLDSLGDHGYDDVEE